MNAPPISLKRSGFDGKPALFNNRNKAEGSRPGMLENEPVFFSRYKDLVLRSLSGEKCFIVKKIGAK